jgi:hypothetical protein
MKSIRTYLVFSFCILVFGCANQGGGYTVGPAGSAGSAGSAIAESSGLSVIVPIFDPGIPDDPEDYKGKGIWPELRRAEANRFAVLLQGELEKTGAFEGVRIAPSSSATGHLYVKGTIVDSNGEDIKLKITVLDITGRKHSSKTYSYRVKEYDLDNPRLAGKDLYAPIFSEIAEDIAKRVDRLSDKAVIQITETERIRFGEAFSPDYFSQFIETSRGGKTKILSSPSFNDPMVRRLDVVRVKDQMFLDGAQLDYLDFSQQLSEPYFTWQRQAYVETKAAREARSKANAQKVLGVLAIMGGIALAASGSRSYYDPSPVIAGAAFAVAGVRAIGAGMETSQQAKMHKDSLNELGKSLNIELAPRVMKLEEKEVELKGTLDSQYSTWRSFLKDFYALEATPQISL